MAKVYKNSDFNQSLYVKEGSQYFALAYAKEMGGTVILCLDRKSNEFVYAFAKICNCFYVDATGGFRTIHEHLQTLNLNDIYEIGEYGVKDAKEYLKKLNVPVTNVEMKCNAREFVRHNRVLFDIMINDSIHTMGLEGMHFSESNDLPYMYAVSYDREGKRWGSIIHSISYFLFLDSVLNIYGFLANKI